MSRRVDLAISVGLLIISLFVIVGAQRIKLLGSLEDPIGARGFAYATGIFTATLAVVLIVVQLRRTAATPGTHAGLGPDLPEEAGDAVAEAAAEAAAGGDDPRYPASAMRAFTIVALTFLFALLMEPIGYLLSTAAFVSAAIAVMGGRGIGRLLIFPVALAVITYGLFDTALSVRLPPGILDPILSLVGLE